MKYKICENSDCRKTFVPKTKDQEYCNDKCSLDMRKSKKDYTTIGVERELRQLIKDIQYQLFKKYKITYRHTDIVKAHIKMLMKNSPIDKYLFKLHNVLKGMK